MAEANPDHDKSNFDDENDIYRSDIQSFSQALPAEIDIFTALSKIPTYLEPKIDLENVKLNCTIGDPPVLLYLPDETSSTPTITDFFYIMTELLGVAQSEYVCTNCETS